MIGELFHGFLANVLKKGQIEVLAVEVPIQILLPIQPGPLWINGKADALNALSETWLKRSTILV
jgi:hypothetical protein